MQTTNVTQAPRSHGYYRRSAPYNPPAIRVGQALPPRDLFIGHDELLAVYDEYSALADAARHHSREQARQEHAQAWQARMVLSAAHINGGHLTVWKPAPRLPEAVSKALDSLTEQADSIDRLRADEASVLEHREQSARAAAANVAAGRAG